MGQADLLTCPEFKRTFPRRKQGTVNQQRAIRRFDKCGRKPPGIAKTLNS